MMMRCVFLSPFFMAGAAIKANMMASAASRPEAMETSHFVFLSNGVVRLSNGQSDISNMNLAGKLKSGNGANDQSIA